MYEKTFTAPQVYISRLLLFVSTHTPKKCWRKKKRLHTRYPVELYTALLDTCWYRCVPDGTKSVPCTCTERESTSHRETEKTGIPVVQVVSPETIPVVQVVSPETLQSSLPQTEAYHQSSADKASCSRRVSFWMDFGFLHLKNTCTIVL